MRYWSFKIYPDRKSPWYYTAHIFHNKKSMYKFRKGLDKDGANKMAGYTFAACCSTYNSTRKGEERQYGVLLFTKGKARSGVVSHEIAHATVYWWKHMVNMPWKNVISGKKDGGKADERFAWILGSMVSQFWAGWYQIPKKHRGA